MTKQTATALLNDLAAKLGKVRGPTSTGWYNFERCPHKTHAKRYTFGVNPAKGLHSCMGCARTGTLASLGYSGVYTKGLAPTATLAPFVPFGASSPHSPDLPWKPISALGTPRGDAEQGVIQYLAGRGISRQRAARLGLGYGTAGVWRGRVIHPYYDATGGLAGWQGRWALEPRDSIPKSLTTAPTRIWPDGSKTGDGEFVISPRSGGLLGLGPDIAGRPLVVVEGPYDQIAVSRVGSAVALLGSRLYDAQKYRILQAKPSQIIVGLDPDKPVEALGVARAFMAHLPGRVGVVQWGKYTGDWASKSDGVPTPSGWVNQILAGAVVPFRLGM